MTEDKHGLFQSEEEASNGGLGEGEEDLDSLDLPAQTSENIASPSRKEDDYVKISKSKLSLIKKLITASRDNHEKLLNLLGGTDFANEENIGVSQMGEMSLSESENEALSQDVRIIEGVFDGENMIGPDGKQYTVPANYASKSKMIEGDMLKLTITPKGTFVYKQIGPIDRIRVIGTLEQNPIGGFVVVSENKKWRVLTASVTYFKAELGDEIVILVPKNGESKWAAVENVVKNMG
jgi:hypothetical protein